MALAAAYLISYILLFSPDLDRFNNPMWLFYQVNQGAVDA